MKSSAAYAYREREREKETHMHTHTFISSFDRVSRCCYRLIRYSIGIKIFDVRIRLSIDHDDDDYDFYSIRFDRDIY